MHTTKSLISVAVLATAGMLLAPAVLAQDVDNRPNVYIGLNHHIFDSDIHVDNDRGWNIGGELPVSDRWAANLERIHIGTSNDAPLYQSTLSLTRLGLNYYWPKYGNWQPFAGIGFGEYKLESDRLGPDIGKTNWDLGAGVKYFLDNNFFLRGEARMFEVNKISATDYGFSLGIGYAFGKTSSAPAPAPVAAKAPAAAPVDSDGDGVLDNADACPNTPRGTKVDARGCELDTDRDGVVDSKDKCPDTPTTLAVDANGCPITETQLMRQTLLVNFDHDKSDVKPQYSGELEKFAQFMKQYASVTAVIEGHTDSDGKDAYNQKLSERRATAVMNSLVKDHGVPANRLSAKGYGESKPIASNDTADGKQKNRRIEAAVSTQVQVQRKR